jgi:deoxyadenosine/deoxycytidine kinase
MVYSLAITGPMGVGKTTFLKQLRDNIYSQPDHNTDTFFAFNELHKSNLFRTRFDSNFDSYSFQLSCLLTSYEQLLRCQSSNMDYITDFWFGEIINVYSKTYFELGFISADQYNTLAENNFNLLSNLHKPKQIVYVKHDSPKTIVDNILNRGRYNESEENTYFLECFVTHLIENFDVTLHNVKEILNFDVITLKPEEIDNFVKDYCKEKKLVITTN